MDSCGRPALRPSAGALGFVLLAAALVVSVRQLEPQALRLFTQVLDLTGVDRLAVSAHKVEHLVNLVHLLLGVRFGWLLSRRREFHDVVREQREVEY